MNGSVSKIVIFLALLIVLGVPFALQPDQPGADPNAVRLDIITPHNDQIRTEFAQAFSDWHETNHATPAEITWHTPGGTSSIVRQLRSIYGAAIKTGKLKPDGTLASTNDPMPYDLMFGGGSYPFDVQLKGEGITVRTASASEPVFMTISQPIDVDQEWLDTIFGKNLIGAAAIYDDEHHWFGSALSGFGIVFNRDVLRELGVKEPTNWHDLADPRLAGWVSLADPSHSGSVTTTYDAILNNFGFEEGWRILRAMSANARSFAHASTKIPVEVSQGEAGVGVAIDFFGRFQSQAVRRQGEDINDSRVGYIDPPGTTFVDPDPICMLRGGPNPEIAKRFIEFVLTEQGQALWQFEAGAKAGTNSAPILGPRQHELRRMPVVRTMYTQYREHFVDKDIDPFTTASDASYRGWRSSIEPMMHAASIAIHDEQQAAWKAIQQAKESGTEDGTLQFLESLFFDWPIYELVLDDPALGSVSLLVEMSGETFRRSRTPADERPTTIAPGDQVPVRLTSRIASIHVDANTGEVTRLVGHTTDDARAVAYAFQITESRWITDLSEDPNAMDPQNMASAVVVLPNEGTPEPLLDAASRFGVRDHIWRALSETERSRLQIVTTSFFRDRYTQIQRLAEEAILSR
ncbi:MAG: extracellular solute-binding protein [Planctomycetota bacterium]